MSLFTKKSLGIDISDHTIEVIELTKKGDDIGISGMSRAVLDVGVIENGLIINEAKLSKTLGHLLRHAKPSPITLRKAVFGLPEAQIYTHVFSTEYDSKSIHTLSKHEMENLIRKETYESIPLNHSDLLYSHKVLSSNQKKTRILIIATDKKVVRAWDNFFRKNNIEIEFYDIETMAIFRALNSTDYHGPVCVVDIGSTSTCISIFDEQGLNYSYCIPEAGTMLTQKISDEFKMNIRKAERFKLERGLSDDNMPILIKPLASIVNEIRNARDIYQEQTNKKIDKVVITGGSSKLKGLSEYLSGSLGIPVSVGNFPIFKDRNDLDFAEVAGLAMRGFNDEPYKHDPYFSVDSKSGIDELDIVEENSISDEPANKAVSVIDDTENETEEKEQMKSNKDRQTKMLIAMGIAVALLILVFVYKAIENQEKTERPVIVTEYDHEQIINLDIPIAATESEYNKERISGRFIPVIIERGNEVDSSVDKSRNMALTYVQANESLWIKPVSANFSTSSIEYLWLVYSTNKIDEYFLNKLNYYNRDNVKYILNYIKKGDVEATANPNIFMISAEISILGNEEIAIPQN